MIHSSSETTASPAPISPFSSYSVPSEPTSDELPDLGAFTTVFRALGHFQSPPRILTLQAQRGVASSTSSSLLSPVELESDVPAGSTVWSQRRIASYLSSHGNETTTDHDTDHEPSPPVSPWHTNSPSYSRSQSPALYDNELESGSNTEGEPEGRPVEIEDISDVDGADANAEQPSLGDLDAALTFLAAERAKWAAQREAGVITAETAWQHVVEPRRKRRRKRNKRKDDTVPSETQVADSAADAADADDSSSSIEQSASTNYYKSTPATPPRNRQEKQRQLAAAVDSNPRLTHSRSTPSLRLSLNTNIEHTDPRVLQLRTLAHKLCDVFPENAAALNAVLANDYPDSPDFIDPRGPPPKDNDTLTHVFIDHSNILIGLLTYLKRYPPQSQARSARKPKHLSHTALALILERGRPITRRVLVTSSPLYQPMETAQRLGYEVRVYARVPDLGDGQDRQRRTGNNATTAAIANSNSNGYTHSTPSGDLLSKPVKKGKSVNSAARGHQRNLSGGTSTESEQGNSYSGFPQAFARSLMAASAPRMGPQVSPTGTTGAGAGNSSSSNAPATTQRIRYREQGVDELLQLKLHQALAAVDVPPPGATIVLATGDGNVSQFDDYGFLGTVRTALKKGWRVELYAWEEGLSRAWMREFGEEEGFKIVGMEQFGWDLLEV